MDATAQPSKAFIKKTIRIYHYLCHYAVLCFNLGSCSLLCVLEHWLRTYTTLQCFIIMLFIFLVLIFLVSLLVVGVGNGTKMLSKMLKGSKVS